MSRLSIDEEQLKSAIEEIVRLNPRPGGQIDDSYAEQAQQVVPDFILELKDGELVMTMPRFSVPELKVNKRYADMLMSSANSDRAGKGGRIFCETKAGFGKMVYRGYKAEAQHPAEHNECNYRVPERFLYQKEMRPSLNPWCLRI
jgi:RNA polymerase sigma-54 factor